MTEICCPLTSPFQTFRRDQSVRLPAPTPPRVECRHERGPRHFAKPSPRPHCAKPLLTSPVMSLRPHPAALPFGTRRLRVECRDGHRRIDLRCRPRELPEICAALTSPSRTFRRDQTVRLPAHTPPRVECWHERQA